LILKKGESVELINAKGRVGDKVEYLGEKDFFPLINDDVGRPTKPTAESRTEMRVKVKRTQGFFIKQGRSFAYASVNERGAEANVDCCTLRVDGWCD
jgi:hypothetical protein